MQDQSGCVQNSNKSNGKPVKDYMQIGFEINNNFSDFCMQNTLSIEYLLSKSQVRIITFCFTEKKAETQTNNNNKKIQCHNVTELASQDLNAEVEFCPLRWLNNRKILLSQGDERQWLFSAPSFQDRLLARSGNEPGQWRWALPGAPADGCPRAPELWPAARPSSCHDLFLFTHLILWPISLLKNYFITSAE